jgi:hypothetical protein
VAGGYSSRYFFDEVVEDYYEVPGRISAVTKEQMVEVSRAMFAEKVWGLGILSSCDRDLAKQLYDQLRPLWD